MSARIPIALILFSRNAKSEAHAKAWLGRSKYSQNRAIARLLIAKAKQNVAHSGFEVYHFDERLQRGETFGQRLANAFSDVFAMGYTAALAVGNDSPELGKTDWLSLQSILQDGGSVVGPTLRGGAYLIGLQASAFCVDGFAALPWQSTQIFEALEDYLQADPQNRLQALPCLRDLNNYSDLRAVLTAPSNPFAQALAQILFARPTALVISTVLQTQFAVLHKSLRAPPSAA